MASSQEPVAALRGEVLTTWTTEQGLPQNFITSLAQTSDGFIWVGTMNGLVRFDGLHFRGFSQDGPPELQGFIGALARDGGGGLWIVTASGLIHYEHQRFVPILFEEKTHYRIESLARANDGELWVYFEGKLKHTHGNRLEAVTLPEGVHRLSNLAQSLDGTLWIADHENIFRVHEGSTVAKYSVPGCQLIYTDRFGDVWAGDGHHLFRFDGSGFQRIENPGLGNFVGVMVDSHRNLWMASGGLHGLSRKSGNVSETLTEADGLASNDVRTILEDRDGDVWPGDNCRTATPASRRLQQLLSDGKVLEAAKPDGVDLRTKRWLHLGRDPGRRRCAVESRTLDKIRKSTRSAARPGARFF